MSTENLRSLPDHGERDTRLKVFTDVAVASKGCVPMLFPFWGYPDDSEETPRSGMFEKYRACGQSYLALTPLQECHVVVLPQRWSREELSYAVDMAKQAQSVGRKLAIFFESDSEEEIPVPNSVVFRNSLYRSKQKPTEFAYAAWSVDFVRRYFANRLPLRRKSPMATVSFCGQCPDPTNARPRAIARLIESKDVIFNPLLRSKFWAGTHDDQGRWTAASLQARQEYVKNMTEGDYVLCVRGMGNYSYRFSETLSCCRIPVFVDTDCVLPYDFKIDWSRYCVWVPERDIDHIGEIVAEFHRRLTPEQFLELQMACRQLWEQWISPEGYFSKFYLHFPESFH